MKLLPNKILSQPATTTTCGGDYQSHTPQREADAREQTGQVSASANNGCTSHTRSLPTHYGQ